VLDLSLPVVAVLVSGRPLTIGWLASRASSVLALWHPGSEAGTALADLLTGSAEPTGRTPISWPASVGQIPLTYAERPSGRPYGGDPHFASQYIDQPNAPLFPFGHGLSYTRFRWCGMRVTPSRFGLGDRLLIEVELANEGARSGEETVLVFVHDKVAQVVRPVLELKAFGRLALAGGASGRLDLTIDAKDLAYPRPDFQPLLEPGEFEILAGPSADRTRLLSCIVELVG
jgi:beta-glucosidase